MTLSPIHVTGSLTIAGTAYPFDVTLTSGTPVSFTNAGVTYHLEQQSVFPDGAIGLWIDSNGTPTQLLSAQLFVVVSAYVPIVSPVINYASTNVSGILDADIWKDGALALAGQLPISSPWTADPVSVPSPLPSTSYGIGINNKALASGLFVGFVPQFSSWSTVHQSPITMMQFKYPF